MRISLKFFSVILVLLVHTGAKAQKGITHPRFLDTITKMRTSVSICGEIHHNPIDVQAKILYDNLKKRGIDTVLIYRCWLNFFGYGKVPWCEKGILNQYRIQFVNRGREYGIKSIKFTTLGTDNIFNFYLKNNIQKVVSNPPQPNFKICDGGEDFVYIDINDKTYCFEVASYILDSDSTNLRTKLVHKLADNYAVIKKLK